MAAQGKGRRERGDEGELNFLRSKGPDPHGMRSKRGVFLVTGVRKSQEVKCHSLPMSTNHVQYGSSF